MNTNTSNKILRYIIYVLLGLTLFVPLIVANWMFFPFITGKALAFRVLVEAAFAVWVILAFRDPSVRPKMSPLFCGVTVFTIIALIVDFTGMNPIRSLWSNFERMEGWITIIHLWAFFVVFSSTVKTRKVWHWFINISFIPATFMAVSGVEQMIAAAIHHQSQPRLDLNLGNAEYLAVYMLFNTFLALYMANISWASVKARVWTWLYAVLSALYIVTIFGSQTRGTILALVGGFFIAGLVYGIFAKDSNQKIGRYIALGICILLVVGSLGFYSIRHTSFVQNNSILNRIASISINNPRLQYIWPMALKGFEQKPILGWGQENFNYVFNKYYDPNAWGQEQWFDRAHNTFIDWAIDGGVVGFVAYAALFVLVIMAIWKRGEDGDGKNGASTAGSRDFIWSLRERAIFTGLIVAYVIHDMFVFDNLASYLMFFITLSFFHSQWPAGKSARCQKMADRIESCTVNPEIISWVIAPIVIVAAVFLLYFINYRVYAENTDLIAAMENCQGAGQQSQGAPALDATLFATAENVGAYVGKQEIREQLFSCAEQVIGAQGVSNDDKLAYYMAASQAFAEQASSTPADLRGFLFAGSFYNDLGQWSQALPYLTHAYDLSSVKQSILFALGQNYISGSSAMASTTEGLAFLKKAYDEASAYPQAQTTYAQGLFVTKDYADAAKMFAEVVAATPTDLQSRLGLAASETYLGDKTDIALAIAQLEYIASSSVQESSAAQGYITQIKAGKNPFIPAPSPATPATASASK